MTGKLTEPMDFALQQYMEGTNNYPNQHTLKHGLFNERVIFDWNMKVCDRTFPEAP